MSKFPYLGPHIIFVLFNSFIFLIVLTFRYISSCIAGAINVGLSNIKKVEVRRSSAIPAASFARRLAVAG